MTIQDMPRVSRPFSVRSYKTGLARKAASLRRAENYENPIDCRRDSTSGVERELIRARTSEGRTRAQARGVRFGRKLKLTPYQRQEALARRAQGEPLVEIARTFGVSHSTISRLHEANSF
jgi:hypothetical protein